MIAVGEGSREDGDGVKQSSRPKGDNLLQDMGGISVPLGGGGLGSWALGKLRAGGQDGGHGGKDRHSFIRLDGRLDGRLDIWKVRRTLSERFGVGRQQSSRVTIRTHDHVYRL